MNECDECEKQIQSEIMKYLLKIDKRCPFCNCKLNPALMRFDEIDEMKVMFICNNHKFKGDKMPLAFDKGYQNLSKMINEIKKGRITVIKATVGFEKFKEKFNIILVN